MSRLPPGPTKLESLRYLQPGIDLPVSALKRFAAKYGDPFRVSYPAGAVTFTGNPEALRAVYSAGSDCFDVMSVSIIEPVFGASSIVVSSRERHRRDRKLLTPAFNASSMRAYGEAIVATAAARAAEWQAQRPFSILATTQAITLDIVVGVVFGVQGEARIRQTREAVLALLESFHPIIFIFPSLRRDFGGFGPWAKNRRAVHALNALLTEEIHARRGGGDARTDILSLMMRARYDDGSAMSDAELLDQLRAILFAGHETTATALAWTLWLLHRHPASLARVLAEIDALGPDPDPDAFASLPFLEAACQEALRLYPPVVDAARMTRAPFEMGEYTIPAGEGIRASLQLLHARPDLYPEPDKFRPERFLDRKYSPFEYIPFGGGARRCLGSAFAMYEMKLVLGTLLRTYRLRLASEAPIPHVRRGLTMGPKGGIPMIMDSRRSAPRSAATLDAAG